MAKKPRFIKPINNFKLKVGAGGIDEILLDTAQEIIKSNKTDFSEYALNFLKRLEQATKSSKTPELSCEQAKDEIIKPIMELKANGGMFNYSLISNIADILLVFIESIHTINDEVYQIIEIHKKTLQVIINNKLTGNGGAEGKALIKELFAACERYKKKHNIF